MKQFLILLSTALLAISCNNKQHEKDSEGLDDVRKRAYFYGPSSYAFQPFNPNYKEVRNAIIDSLHTNPITIISSDSLRIESKKTLQLSNNLSVDVYSSIFMGHENYVYAIIDTLEFKKSSGGKTTKTAEDILENDYWKIVNYERQSRDNLYGLIKRLNPSSQVSTPTIYSVYNNSGVVGAKKIDEESLNNGYFSKKHTFLDFTLPPEIDFNLLKKNLKEDFIYTLPTNWEEVSGNLDDEYILTLYSTEPKCTYLSFKIITKLTTNRLHSYITHVENDVDSLNTECYSYIDFFKNYMKEILLYDIGMSLSIKSME